MNKDLKKNVFVLVVPVLLTMILILGATYALFTKTVNSNKEITIKNTIKTEEFSLI